MLKDWILFLCEFEYVPDIIFGLNVALHKVNVGVLACIWIEIIEVCEVLLIVNYIETVGAQDVWISFKKDVIDRPSIQIIVIEALLLFRITCKQWYFNVVKILWSKVTLDLKRIDIYWAQEVCF